MKMHYLENELHEYLRTDGDIFRFLEEATLDGIWFWDLENPEEEWMSPSFWRTFGYDPDEMPHKSSAWQEIIHPYDLEVARESARRHLKDPDVPYDQVVRYTHKDGSIIWVRCRGVAIRDDKGKPIRMLGAHTNITDFTEFKHNHTKLLDANERFSGFVRASSHDLNAPLKTLQGQLSYLQQYYSEALDDVGEKLLSDGLETVFRMQSIVEGLGTYARMNHSNTLEVERVETTALVDGIIQDFQGDIDEINADVNLVQLHNVEASPELLDRIFRNLIANAILYRNPSRPLLITVGSERNDNETVFYIRDNGLGVPHQFQQQIFAPFKRLHRWSKSKGSGLGLSLCQKAVSKMRGRIWLESKEDIGSSFYFSIPHLLSQKDGKTTQDSIVD